MKKLTDAIRIGSLELKNRLVRSATFDLGMVEDGVMLPAMLDYYRRLAEGGAGLIFTGMFGVCENSRNNQSMMKIYCDRFERDLVELVDVVHRAGAKIGVQLGHTGVKAGVIEVGEHPFGPSDYGNAIEMPCEEIARVVKSYGVAAGKVKRAGADAVEIHGAHGYLLSQFLSPYYNHRTDEYGGGIEGRSRIIREIYAAMRVEVGSEFPILLKVNYCDLIEGGLTGEECIWLCKELEKMGIDAVEISSGVAVSRESNSIQRGKGEAFNGEYALDVAAHIQIPVINVGGYRTVPVMEEYLNKGNLAAVSLCRPLIREPDLPKRWLAGEQAVPKCISCNYCFKETVLGCAVEKNQAK